MLFLPKGPADASVSSMNELGCDSCLLEIIGADLYQILLFLVELLYESLIAVAAWILSGYDRLVIDSKEIVIH